LGELIHACLDVMIKIRSSMLVLSHRWQCQDGVPHLYNTVSLTSIEVARRTHQLTVMHGQFQYAEVKGSQCMPLASSCCFLRFPWAAFARPCTAAYLLSLQAVTKAISPQLLLLYTNLPLLHPQIPQIPRQSSHTSTQHVSGHSFWRAHSYHHRLSIRASRSTANLVPGIEESPKFC
jgi:hypothetical protein